jgi:hypothetical protein
MTDLFKHGIRWLRLCNLSEHSILDSPLELDAVLSKHKHQSKESESISTLQAQLPSTPIQLYFGAWSHSEPISATGHTVHQLLISIKVKSAVCADPMSVEAMAGPTGSQIRVEEL